jgi:putative transposase
MKTQRRFRPEFKRQVIEELLSGDSSPAQIIRLYEISSGLLYHWKKQYAALSRNINAQLSLRALHMALQSRTPPSGVIHHSDQGVQHAARDYVDTLHFHDFRIRMARRGNPDDNAVAESFLKILKTEEVYLWECETLADVGKRVPYFIEEVYNRKRLHSSLSYRPPEEFERMFLKNNNPTPVCPL